MSTAVATTSVPERAATGHTPALTRDRNAVAVSAQPLSAAWFKTMLGGNSVVPVLVVAAAFIAIAVAAILWASGPTYQVLYSNLSEADGGAVINELDRRTIPYRFSQGGQAILVPSDKVHSLRLQLAEQGLPKGGTVGFELMDNQAFGVSQFTEQLNFQRGLEGELARSMESLGPVAKARIHLAMAKPSVFVKQRVPAKASVVLNLHPGRTLSEAQVNAIVHMVASSVPDLATENVSVVDQRGELLSRPGGPMSGLDGSQLKYTREVESSYEERIANILSPVLGDANFRVQVTAQVDFSAVEETNEAYAPNQSPENSAVRSSQTNTNFTGDEATARGIPGALSNSAPNWSPSPIEAEAGQDESDGTTTAAQASLQSSNIVNYEVDRNIRHIKHQLGATRRLSVAVVVNHRPAKNAEGNDILEPLPQDELDQITRLVRQAVGYSETRGDQVEVVNSPFSEVVEPEIEEIDWWRTPLFINSLVSALRYLLVAILILMGYRLIIKPLMKKHLGIEFVATDKAAVKAISAPAGHAAGAGSDDESLTEGRDAKEGAFKRANKAASYSQQLVELKKIAEEDPRMIAMIVRNWMKDDG